MNTCFPYYISLYLVYPIRYKYYDRPFLCLTPEKRQYDII